MDAVLRDHRSAPISEPERALFGFIELVSRASSAVTQADVDRVIAAGWSEEALYDAITVCSLFRFYNTWVDATGVSDLPAAAYAAGGERMARRGYLPETGDARSA